MLLHLTPRVFTPYTNVKLIDICIEPFGLHLRNGCEVAVRRPYPNKQYNIACRRKGNTAIDGIFVEVSGRVCEFNYTARWDVGGFWEAAHKVRYEVIDEDFDAADENSRLWYVHSKRIGVRDDWSCRWPGARPAQNPGDGFDMGPLARQAKIAMVVTEDEREIMARPHHGSTERYPTGEVEMIEPDRIIEYRQQRKIPTIERERLLTSWAAERYPRLEDVFRV